MRVMCRAGKRPEITVTHLGVNPTEQDLTLLSGRDVVLSLWYSDSQLENGSSVNSDNFDATDLRF